MTNSFHILQIKHGVCADYTRKEGHRVTELTKDVQTKPIITSFPFNPKLLHKKNKLLQEIHTVIVFLFTISIFTTYAHCMDVLPSPPKIQYESIYLKFETNIRHQNNTYGIDLFIPYNYTTFVAQMVFDYRSYLQTVLFEKKIIVSLKRKDGERVQTYFKDLLRLGPDMSLLQTLKDDVEYLTVALLQHLDDYLVPHINLNKHLNNMKPRFASIEGVWKKEFSWASQNLKGVTFAGIYQTDAYSYLDDVSTGTLVFIAFDSNYKVTKVEGETEFQIFYNLLEAIHFDLFKNKRLNHYQFIVARIVQQGFRSRIYIHKKCINVLRLLDNEPKEQDIMVINMNSVDIFLPYMCYFNRLGTIISNFKTSLTIEHFGESVEQLSVLVGEYLAITSKHKQKGNLFVPVRKSLVKPIINIFIGGNSEDINACKILDGENFVLLDYRIVEDVNNKIYKIIIGIFETFEMAINQNKDFK